MHVPIDKLLAYPVSIALICEDSVATLWFCRATKTSARENPCCCNLVAYNFWKSVILGIKDNESTTSANLGLERSGNSIGVRRDGNVQCFQILDNGIVGFVFFEVQFWIAMDLKFQG
jgi:hypothetical protein